MLADNWVCAKAGQMVGLLAAPIQLEKRFSWDDRSAVLLAVAKVDHWAALWAVRLVADLEMSMVACSAV